MLDSSVHRTGRCVGNCRCSWKWKWIFKYKNERLGFLFLWEEFPIYIIKVKHSVHQSHLKINPVHRPGFGTSLLEKNSSRPFFVEKSVPPLFFLPKPAINTLCIYCIYHKPMKTTEWLDLTYYFWPSKKWNLKFCIKNSLRPPPLWFLSKKVSAPFFSKQKYNLRPLSMVLARLPYKFWFAPYAILARRNGHPHFQFSAFSLQKI